MGKKMGGRFKKEGIYVYLWLIHVEVRQKTTKFCKAIILQLKNKLKKRKKLGKKACTNFIYYLLESRHILPFSGNLAGIGNRSVPNGARTES